MDCSNSDARYDSYAGSYPSSPIYCLFTDPVCLLGFQLVCAVVILLVVAEFSCLDGRERGWGIEAVMVGLLLFLLGMGATTLHGLCPESSFVFLRLVITLFLCRISFSEAWKQTKHSSGRGVWRREKGDEGMESKDVALCNGYPTDKVWKVFDCNIEDEKFLRKFGNELRFCWFEEAIAVSCIRCFF